jgi:protein tyrosine phosphatase
MIYEIIPHLWLGDVRDVKDLPENITMVVNCTKDIPFYYDNKTNIRIDVNDVPDETYNMLYYWTDTGVFRLMSLEISKGTNVLVHCHAGRQRSAATIAAYLMWRRLFTKSEAIAHIKKIKKEAFFPIVNFDLALSLYAVHLDNNKQMVE